MAITLISFTSGSPLHATQDLSRGSDHYHIGRHILRHDGASPNNRIFTNGYPRENDRPLFIALLQ